MPKNNTAKNSYVQGRDSTSGRNHVNPQLKDLDANYANHPARSGTNHTAHDFSGGKRVKSTPINHDSETGLDNRPINQREDQPAGTPIVVEPFDPRK